jgi:lipopolysaccharide/colanic/teichoic acid biosynthesis glycosyltransferase
LDHCDPRCTPIGRFLRKTTSTNYPNFPMCCGDMSVVGPRPERPYYVHKFRNDIARYHSRHRLKVGITGWAQVNGCCGNTSIHKRLEYDLYYIRHRSLAFDLQIILRILLSGMVGKNAY